MPLGVISRVSFGIWGDFWRKTQKGETRKSGIFGFLRHSVGNPRRGTPSGTLRRSFSTPQRSSSTPRHRHCSP